MSPGAQASKEETRERSECVTPERHGTGGETEGQKGSENRKEREGVDNRREERTDLGANRTPAPLTNTGWDGFLFGMGSAKSHLWVSVTQHNLHREPE